MRKIIVSLVSPFMLSIMALTLGWFAHAALPLSAQGMVVDGRGTLSNSAVPAALVGSAARLTYQGRLSNNTGVPVNTTTSMVFRLYDSMGTLLWTSATRSVTPVNGLFTVYLGDGTDPNLISVVLENAVSIGVTVGGDAEMQPRQALNTVVGHSDSAAGVVGSSTSGDGVVAASTSGDGVVAASTSGAGIRASSTSYFGVYAASTSGAGVFAASTSGDGVFAASTSSFGVVGESTSSFGVIGKSTSGDGVLGSTGAITRAGVLAEGAGPSGYALSILYGGIQVSGAGISTTTPVFVHVADASNIALTNQTIISHTLTNNDPDAILIVTPVNNYANVASTNNAHPVGVLWRADINRWVIYNIDSAAMPDNARFNVMVIKR